jgi:pimeloyl-ACP methyl ester carboxylesterase
VTLACDPWHRAPSPLVYRIEDTLACWRRIEAPVQLQIAEHGYVIRRFGADPKELESLLAVFRNLATVPIPDSGHAVHHDQPTLVAAAIEDFLTETAD